MARCLSASRDRLSPERRPASRRPGARRLHATRGRRVTSERCWRFRGSPHVDHLGAGPAHRRQRPRIPWALNAGLDRLPAVAPFRQLTDFPFLAVRGAGEVADSNLVSGYQGLLPSALVLQGWHGQTYHESGRSTALAAHSPDFDDGRARDARLASELRVVSAVHAVRSAVVVRDEHASAMTTTLRRGRFEEQPLPSLAALSAGHGHVVRGAASPVIVGRFVGQTVRRQRVVDRMPGETDEPATLDPHRSESVGEDEILEDQRRLALQATIAEGHAAALLVLARMDRRRRRHGTDDTAPGLRGYVSGRATRALMTRAKVRSRAAVHVGAPVSDRPTYRGRWVLSSRSRSTPRSFSRLVGAVRWSVAG